MRVRDMLGVVGVGSGSERVSSGGWNEGVGVLVWFVGVCSGG